MFSQAYPYTGVNGPCRSSPILNETDSPQPVFKPDGYFWLVGGVTRLDKDGVGAGAGGVGCDVLVGRVPCRGDATITTFSEDGRNQGEGLSLIRVATCATPACRWGTLKLWAPLRQPTPPSSSRP